MDFVKSWTVSVCLTLIISVVFSLISPKGTMGRFYKVIISVFIFISFIYPLTDFDFSEFSSDFRIESDYENTQENMTEIQVEGIIKNILTENGIENTRVSCTVSQNGDEISIDSIEVAVPPNYNAEEVQKLLFDSAGVAADVTCFGQELNPFTFGIAKADMLIRGGDPDNMQFGDTLDDDKFEGYQFDYCISNPPFGIDWKREAAAVEAEHKKGPAGRFGPGLPSKSDGQMLFLLTAISKMKEPKDGGSRIAIIHNGSPLFTGDAGSGPSEIRRYILENDLLEAIIALPNDIFYNTGIATYIWVLSNKKAGTRREGKVQLINANGLYEKRRKALGNKRNDIPESAIAEITRLYGDFVESEISKIFDTADFGYTKITVERPLKDENGQPVLKKGKPQPDTALRDTENVPLKENIQTYFEREVLPFAPDAWIDEKKSKVGYEIPFTRYFYKYEAPKLSAEIMQEILAIESELDGALAEVSEA